MVKLHSWKKIGLFIYINFYLIFPELAISQNTKVDIKKNLENGLNNRNLEMIKNVFNEEQERLMIEKKFSTIIEEFPDAKWNIKKIGEGDSNEKIFEINVMGKSIINGETYVLKSKFKYIFSTINNKIHLGEIKNLLTTIRNDNNQIDISFNIPEKVLTGTKYHIDIILNEPLGDLMIAGGIKSHQDESYLKQEINIEPLGSGGIFKITRAPSKPGIQIWSGIIAHPKGLVSFTKSVDIVDKYN